MVHPRIVLFGQAKMLGRCGQPQPELQSTAKKIGSQEPYSFPFLRYREAGNGATDGRGEQCDLLGLISLFSKNETASEAF